MHRLVSHPDQIASYLRQRTTWRDLQPRGDRDHDALGWEDAAAALAGCSPLAAAAFYWCHLGDASARRELAAHLHGVLARLTLPESVDPDALVQLALDEQQAPESQRKDALRALVLGVPAKVWQTRYRTPHARLLGEIDSLVADAWRCARARLDDAA